MKIPKIPTSLVFKTTIILLAAAPLATAIFFLSAHHTPVAQSFPQPTTAKPVLMEFGDFQCPHCANFAFTILPQLKRTYIDTGLLQFEYRHYPFLGKPSFQSAMASECARDQSRFSDYHDELFSMLDTGTPYTQKSLIQASINTDLDQPLFTACLQEELHRTRVDTDLALGKSLGVRGTPTLFINNEPLEWTTRKDLFTRIQEHLTQPTP